MCTILFIGLEKLAPMRIYVFSTLHSTLYTTSRLCPLVHEHPLAQLLLHLTATFRAVILWPPSYDVRPAALRAPYILHPFHLAMLDCGVEHLLTILAHEEMHLTHHQ